MKARIAVSLAFLLALAAIVLATILLSPSLPPRVWAVGVPQWKSQEPISVTTRTDRRSVLKGDAFFYSVEVWYNTDAVADIDRVSLGKATNLAPFEVRSIRESEFSPEPKLRVYRREYELQMVQGKVGRTYEFPEIVVRYRPRGSAGLLSVSATPQPIFVASRFPADIADLDLELNPIAPPVVDLGRSRASWGLLALGALLASAATVDLVRRVIPQWKGCRHPRDTKGEGGLLADGYRSLLASIASGVEPQRVLYQVDHLLRAVLASKDQLDWLEDPRAATLSPAVRDVAAQLFERCEKACRPGSIAQEEVQQALGELEAILRYFYGEREVEAWRS